MAAKRRGQKLGPKAILTPAQVKHAPHHRGGGSPRTVATSFRVARTTLWRAEGRGTITKEKVIKTDAMKAKATTDDGHSHPGRAQRSHESRARRRDVSVAWTVRQAVAGMIEKERQQADNPELPLIQRILTTRRALQ